MIIPIRKLLKKQRYNQIIFEKWKHYQHIHKHQKNVSSNLDMNTNVFNDKLLKITKKVMQTKDLFSIIHLLTILFKLKALTLNNLSYNKKRFNIQYFNDRSKKKRVRRNTNKVTKKLDIQKNHTLRLMKSSQMKQSNLIKKRMRKKHLFHFSKLKKKYSLFFRSLKRMKKKKLFKSKWRQSTKGTMAGLLKKCNLFLISKFQNKLHFFNSPVTKPQLMTKPKIWISRIGRHHLHSYLQIGLTQSVNKNVNDAYLSLKSKSLLIMFNNITNILYNKSEAVPPLKKLHKYKLTLPEDPFIPKDKKINFRKFLIPSTHNIISQTKNYKKIINMVLIRILYLAAKIAINIKFTILELEHFIKKSFHLFIMYMHYVRVSGCPLLCFFLMSIILIL
jgi:hypothetical protein